MIRLPWSGTWPMCHLGLCLGQAHRCQRACPALSPASSLQRETGRLNDSATGSFLYCERTRYIRRARELCSWPVLFTLLRPWIKIDSILIKSVDIKSGGKWKPWQMTRLTLGELQQEVKMKSTQYDRINKFWMPGSKPQLHFVGETPYSYYPKIFTREEIRVRVRGWGREQGGRDYL